MTQKELEQKVIDAEGRVAKREAVLKKHNSQLAKMIEKGADRFDISIKREDIKSATSKLAEARETLANWRDKLNTRITRDAYLEANTPEILKDFLENWKQHAIGYYREKRIRFIEYTRPSSPSSKRAPASRSTRATSAGSSARLSCPCSLPSTTASTTPAGRRSSAMRGARCWTPSASDRT